MPLAGPGFSGALRRALWAQPLRRALSAKIDSALPCPSLSTHALAPSRALAGPLRLAWQLVTYLLTTYSLTHLQLGDRPCRSKTFNATLGVASRSRSTPSRSPRHSSSRKINQTFNGASFLASSASQAVVALSSLAEDGTPSAVELALLTSSGRREISRAAMPPGDSSRALANLTIPRAVLTKAAVAEHLRRRDRRVPMVNAQAEPVQPTTGLT